MLYIVYYVIYYLHTIPPIFYKTMLLLHSPAYMHTERERGREH